MLLTVMCVAACVANVDAAGVIVDVVANNVVVAYDDDDDDDVIAIDGVSDDAHGDIVATAVVT